MDYVEQLQTLDEVAGRQVIFDALNSAAIDALNDMKNEARLDEVSKQTLDSYVDKSSKNWSKNHTTRRNSTDDLEKEKSDKEKNKRSKGLESAFRKLPKEDLDESTEHLDEARKVDEFESGTHKATIHKDTDTGEYKVKFHTDGKHLKDADYFTDEKDDAIGTAKHQIEKMNKVK